MLGLDISCWFATFDRDKDRLIQVFGVESGTEISSKQRTSQISDHSTCIILIRRPNCCEVEYAPPVNKAISQERELTVVPISRITLYNF